MPNLNLIFSPSSRSIPYNPESGVRTWSAATCTRDSRIKETIKRGPCAAEHEKILDTHSPHLDMKEQDEGGLVSYLDLRRMSVPK